MIHSLICNHASVTVRLFKCRSLTMKTSKPSKLCFKAKLVFLRVSRSSLDFDLVVRQSTMLVTDAGCLN